MKNPIAELLEAVTYSATQERTCSFIESIENMSEDAQLIVRIIFESPVEFAKLANQNPRTARSEVLRFLREDQGWGWPRCWSSFREIKTALGVVI